MKMHSTSNSASVTLNGMAVNGLSTGATSIVGDASQGKAPFTSLKLADADGLQARRASGSRSFFLQD